MTAPGTLCLKLTEQPGTSNHKPDCYKWGKKKIELTGCSLSTYRVRDTSHRPTNSPRDPKSPAPLLSVPFSSLPLLPHFAHETHTCQESLPCWALPYQLERTETDERACPRGAHGPPGGGRPSAASPERAGWCWCC